MRVSSIIFSHRRSMKKLSFILFLLLILTGMSTPPLLEEKPSALEGNNHRDSSPSLNRTSTGIQGLEKAKKMPDGTLVVNSKISGNGTIHARHVIIEGHFSPGNSPGCVNFGGNLTYSSTSTLTSEIAGLTPCDEYDQLGIAGTLTIDNNATHYIVLLDGYVPTLEDTFNILNWGSIVGTFGTIDTSGAVLPEPLVWDTSQLYVTGELIVSVTQYADGDLAPWGNPDGLINAADILIAEQLALGQRTAGTLQYAHGDMNTDGIIDLADLLLIQQVVF